MYNYTPENVINYINSNFELSIKNVEQSIKDSAEAIKELSGYFQSPVANEGIDAKYKEYIETLDSELKALQRVAEVVNRLYVEANKLQNSPNE